MDEETLLKDAAAAVQLVQQQQQQQQSASSSLSTTPQPPAPLPMHWVIRESRSQPGYYYYYNHETGVCSWYPPHTPSPLPPRQQEPQQPLSTALPQNTTKTTGNHGIVPPQKDQTYSLEELGNLSAAVVAAAATASGIAPTTAAGLSEQPTNHSVDTTANTHNQHHHNNNHHSSKRSISDGSSSDITSNKRSNTNHHSTSTSGSISSSHNKTKSPHEVRVIHILKKHRESRKPTSWRVPVITATKDEAREELQALLDVLRDVQHDKQELRATMEELARTESDCSSYKRNGDLGYFTRKKMQPQFEDTAFSLPVNELSDIIETSSGLHVLLRIG